jgi:hypothetical protein
MLIFLASEDFKSLFDPQVNRIIALVRQQLNLMQQTHDNKYVVSPAHQLSGGAK